MALNDQASYALGWWVFRTLNGAIVWHDGDALSFGSFVGMLPDRHVGVVILTNETNEGLPAAIGAWLLDRILGNPEHDYAAAKLKEAKAAFEAKAGLFARPANPRPFPPLAPLAGDYFNPSFGRVAVTEDRGALAMQIQATGAELKLEPWDGDVFMASLKPTGPFAPIVDLDYMTRGFAQFQMDGAGKLNRLRLSTADGQAYEFRADKPVRRSEPVTGPGGPRRWRWRFAIVRMTSLGARVFLLLAPLVPVVGSTGAQAAMSGDFAGLVDIGGGRKMYLECHGAGSPTVVLVSGLRGSADDWSIAGKPEPTVYAGVATFTRVCAYDRPGTPVGEQASRSDPAPQPATAGDAVADLHALLRAAHEAGPYVLVGHSYGGLIVRLIASDHPEDISGLVLVDALSEGLREAENS